MSNEEAGDAPSRTATAGGVLTWLKCRSELIVVAGVIAIAIFLTVGTITMTVPEGAGTPGPKFFPTLVAGFLYLLAAALTVVVLRNPGRPDGAIGGAEVSTDMLSDFGDIENTGEIRVIKPGSGSGDDAGDGEPEKPPIDWRTVGIVLAGLTGFVLLLNPVGWLLSATALFWVVCFALGSKRPVFDIGVSALFAALIQLAFSAGLGLNLPAGVFEGIL